MPPTEKLVRFTLDPANPPRLTEEEAARLDSMTEEDIDLSDIPALPAAFFERTNAKTFKR